MATFKPSHCGLTFTEIHLERVRKNLKREPFVSAWAALERENRTGVQLAQIDSLRYLIAVDSLFADQAIGVLQTSHTLNADQPSYLRAMMDTLAFMQTFEMLRGYPGFRADLQQQMLTLLFERVNALNAPPPTQHFEQLWLGVVNVAAGVVMEREDVFMAGVERYRETVQTAIHPEGYFHPAVEPGDGNGLYRQLLSAAAMVLMAEIASHVGMELWTVAQRGVSITTAGLYTIFYYYYPERWRWDKEIPQDTAVFRQHGGFLEILYAHTKQKAMDSMLEDLRPIYDPAAGGMTTLTHASAKARGLFR